MQVDSSIFKAYDIRGVVDKTLTEDVARAVGRVLGSLAVEANVSAFCVGRDGRLSGERLMNALVEGIASTGMKVTTASHWMATVIVWGLLQSRAKSFSRIA